MSSTMVADVVIVYIKGNLTSLPGIVQAGSIVQSAGVTLPHGLPAHLLLHAQC